MPPAGGWAGGDSPRPATSSGSSGRILLVLSVVILVFAIAVGGFSFEVGSTTTS